MVKYYACNTLYNNIVRFSNSNFTNVVDDMKRIMDNNYKSGTIFLYILCKQVVYQKWVRSSPNNASTKEAQKNMLRLLSAFVTTTVNGIVAVAI